MPEGMRYDGESGVPCWVSDVEKVRIAKEDEVRLRVIGSRVDATQLVRLMRLLHESALLFAFASKLSYLTIDR